MQALNLVGEDVEADMPAPTCPGRAGDERLRQRLPRLQQLREQGRAGAGPTSGDFLATELFLAGLGACMLATLVDYGQPRD
ncbi:hypothetical protein [Actinopolymorpha alba]|uniref:hypothetical protein n=1 Tax=Actinopolymorpha alba TaxID=533267 RepID=UPI000376469C|nr:hypothetical protein [Actinopolymorpha alba]